MLAYRLTDQRGFDWINVMQVTVETLGPHGFLVNVFSDKQSCPGLLVSILEAFDELGLSVLQATASCADTLFRLEAVGGEVRIIYKIAIVYFLS